MRQGWLLLLEEPRNWGAPLPPKEGGYYSIFQSGSLKKPQGFSQSLRCSLFGLEYIMGFGATDLELPNQPWQ